MSQGSLLDPAPIVGPELRVLFCLVCDTREELPAYDGPVENDALLDILVSRHVFPSGEPHRGHLFRIPQLQWENDTTRRSIVEQIKGGGSAGIDEFDREFYASKNTFREDAMACFNQHLRPSNGCEDFNSEKKVLLPDTKAERKSMGMAAPSKAPGPKNHLCDFCPVKSVVDQKKRELRGDYR